MDEYLQTLEVFYEQKMKYLTKKDKYIRCNDCEGKKTFTETQEKLVLTCGEEEGKCGPQIEIELPKYIHYEKHLDELRDALNNEYNWEALEKFLKVDDEVEKSREKQKKINEEIKRIERLFFEKNMEMKQKELQDFYDQRIRKTKKCKEITKSLQNKGLTEEQKKEYRREYIRNVQELNKEYIEINELMKDINPFLMEEEPNIKILHDNFEYKKVKKKSSDREYDDILIDKIIQEFIKNEGVLTKENYTNIKGKHKTSWGNSLFRHLKSTSINPWKKKEQDKYGSIIEEPESSDPDYIQLTKPWKNYLFKDFEKGMKVSWLYKGKKKYGVIKEIKGTKAAEVEGEDGKTAIRMFNKLLKEDIYDK